MSLPMMAQHAPARWNKRDKSPYLASIEGFADASVLWDWQSRYLSLAVLWRFEIPLSFLSKKPPSFWWGLFAFLPTNAVSPNSNQVFGSGCWIF